MKKYIFIVGLLFPFCISAQTILGKVTNDKKEPLIGASVYWLGTTIGVITGNKGEFEISVKDISNKKLIASYVGHSSDTIEIINQTFVEFRLQETQTLGEVIVQGQRDGVIISDIKPIKTEQITQTELGKAACCDDGCVFLDFSYTTDKRINLCRISFDGYGCCNIGNNTKYLDDQLSKEFIVEIGKDNLDQEKITKVVLELIRLNKDNIWTDALEEYKLIDKE